MIHLFLNQSRYDVTGMADGGVGGGGGMWDDFGGDDWRNVGQGSAGRGNITGGSADGGGGGGGGAVPLVPNWIPL